jgi:hypothetical protein
VDDAVVKPKRPYNNGLPRKRHPDRKQGRPWGAKTKALIIVKEQRTAEILRLARQGWQCQAIGDKLGIMRQEVYRLIHTALEEARTVRKEEVELLTELERQRLDAMTAGVQEMAEKGDAKKIDSALKIMDRRAKLLGLDAPVKQEIDTAVEIRIGKEFDNV